MRHRPAIHILCIFVLLLAKTWCFAQIDRAGLNGTVRDATGARVPGAHVIAVQPSTGLHREGISSMSGNYDVPELPVGVCRVTCSASGFEEVVFEGVELTVGRTLTLNVGLQVGGIAQRVSVSSQTSQLDETSATLGVQTEPRQVKDLPLNGRNWSTLTALAPGAVDTGGSNQRSIRFAGRGLNDNNFTYDGIDATNIVNQAQQPFVRLAIPAEAIAEFLTAPWCSRPRTEARPAGKWRWFPSPARTRCTAACSNSSATTSSTRASRSFPPGFHNSAYEGSVASLQRRYTRGLLLAVNYTYSHEIDQDAAGGGDSDYPENPACLLCERASGDYDVRHALNVNGVYDLPFGFGRPFLSQPGVVGAFVSRWSLTAIGRAGSGLPINVTEDRSSSSVATGYATNQRPNRVPGVSPIPPGGRRIQGWINPAALARVTYSGYGNAPRNTARGPNLWQADLGVTKRIPLTESAQLQFRGEFFNLFNRAQYGQQLSDLSASSFGQIITTVNTGPVGTGTPRQTQFELKIGF